MVLGVGGSSLEAELARMAPMADRAVPIGTDEYRGRIARAQAALRAAGIDGLYLDAAGSLAYFTGVSVRPSERLHGAVIPAQGDVTVIGPAFEAPKLRGLMRWPAALRGWEEDEDPAALVLATLGGGTVAIDPATPFFTVDAMRRDGVRLVSGSAITAGCRQVKSAAELALMQLAMDISLAVHAAAARGLQAGVGSAEVRGFIEAAHRRLGGSPAFAAVQFGEATAYPHGASAPQTLAEGDMVLVDLGCVVEGYRSDITRSYVFGAPTTRQRAIWALELRAQWAGFRAARLGAACEAVDAAARAEIVAAGFGPGFQVPGLPHRTGHGVGLNIHEEPYMVGRNRAPIEAGMCFSIEPMICLYGEFGVRLEDVVAMTASGPRWFTEPCRSIDDPFGVS